MDCHPAVNDQVKALLNSGPPWLGDCAFKDKNAVKKLGGRWRAEEKKWAAMDERMLASLIEERVWFPVEPCLRTPGGFVRIPLLIREAVARKIRQREKVDCDAEIKKRASVAASARQVPHEERDDDAFLRRELLIPDDEIHHLVTALKNGVDASVVKSTSRFRQLGPRSGISDAARLIRAIDLEVLTWESVRSGEAALLEKTRTRTSKAGGGKRQRRA